MIKTRKMDLQLFGEGGDGGAAGTGAEGGGSAAEVRVGDVLEDGTVVDENLASSMREYADLYRNQAQQVHAQAPEQGQDTNGQQQAREEQPAEPTEEEWNEAKKKFGKFYGRDVHAAVNDRFKNQADATKQLEQQQKVIDAMMKQTGATNFQELQDVVLNTALEQEAEEQDLTVEQLKHLKEMEEENKRYKQAEESARNREHINGLIQQAEELKKIYPDFDLVKEMANPQFQLATSPAVGMTVEQAFMAFHGKDLQAQVMAYGVQAGKEQTAKALQANARRPVEGANRGGGNGGSVQPNMENMTDELYESIRNRTMQGENVTI